ncbi:hypothetical protein CLV65_0469 [Pseudoscardovia suis]|uniref:Uncharacterized protein n=1 Tax=Pseudoscardovia suis TaxID=987063 RepID=A0A261ES03_9BIFI|nr:hypothetical protein PSSU_1458 [Pseudoscardovia suis]PJJ69753.1 hypothetical protein CLV65_0469 [Pseudoscardovia suis]
MQSLRKNWEPALLLIVSLWSFSAADLPLQRHRFKHHDSHRRWAPTCMPRRSPADGTNWSTLGDGCPSPREATSIYLAPKEQDYVSSACNTRITDDKRLSKPHQGAKLCTLGTTYPHLEGAIGTQPRPRHKPVHPRHELPFPKGHQERLILAECARSRTLGKKYPGLGQVILEHGQAPAHITAAQSAKLCTLGKQYQNRR